MPSPKFGKTQYNELKNAKKPTSINEDEVDTMSQDEIEKDRNNMFLRMTELEEEEDETRYNLR